MHRQTRSTPIDRRQPPPPAPFPDGGLVAVPLPPQTMGLMDTVTENTEEAVVRDGAYVPQPLAPHGWGGGCPCPGMDLSTA